MNIILPLIVGLCFAVFFPFFIGKIIETFFMSEKTDLITVWIFGVFTELTLVICFAIGKGILSLIGIDFGG